MVYHTRQRPAPGARCEWPGCRAAASYPAPRAADRLHDYVWFCLDHVRAYNREWSFCPDMDRADIDAAVRSSLEPGGRHGRFSASPHFDDPLDIFGAAAARNAAGCMDGGVGAAVRTPSSRRWPPGSPEAEAAAAMALSDDMTLPALKSRYKELVKHHHPDANGGCPASEERMKSITRAYRVLHEALSAAPAR
ncbi:MAG: J domain-containing protein [Alphaproteobacteria bacterium]|nr:J domain-containing protein [Alphaproteobacteria bacterium]MCY3755607.1 J domain-containing protein [Alphaproteobacteria bacterium]